MSRVSMSLRRISTGAALVVIGGLAATVLRAEQQTFDGPEYEGFLVSYCGADAASCGEQMAVAWCQIQGFDTASDWAGRSGVDALTEAVRLDDGLICQGASCESFAQITCGREKQGISLSMLGPAVNSTVLSPSQRTTEATLDRAEYRVLIPGCDQEDAGIFLCHSVYEFQHCRTLMIGQMVHSCRVNIELAAGISDPYLAADGDYDLTIESDARIRITHGSRGFGLVKGKAEVALAIRPPVGGESLWCLQRDPYTYFQTGPEGGIAEVGETAACDAPIEFSFEAHEDDMIRAYDLCESFFAWGSKIQDSIGILAGGLFHVRSANPEFLARNRSGTAILAPYVAVAAPLEIDCRD